MRALKFLIIIPVLAYGLVMGYLWYEVKGSADDMVKAASGFAEIKYDSVHVSPLGDEVGLNEMVIKPLMTQDEFRIEKVRLSAPHVGYFLKMGNSLDKKKLPEKLGMKIQRIHLDLNSELFGILEQMQAQAAMSQGQDSGAMMSNLDGLGCGDKESLTLSDYRQMGLGNIVADAEFDIGYDENNNRTVVNMHLSADNLYNMDIQSTFDAPPDQLSSSATSGRVPDMKIDYRDTGYFKLRNAYCAEQNDSSVNEYVDRHINMLVAELGATFPDKIINAYRQHMLKGGTITASMHPADDMPATGLQYYPAEDIMDMLGLKISINGTGLNLKQVSWGEPGSTPPKVAAAKKTEPSMPATMPRPRVEERPTPTTTTKRPSYPTFHKVDLNKADQHLDQTVEVTLYNGKVRKGTLEKVNNGRLYLVMEMHGGTLSYPVKVSDVQQLRVKY